MPKGKVEAIFISPVAGEPMQRVEEVEAVVGAGLRGDRYCTGEGSFNRGRQGRRQVTLINGAFFEGSGFTFEQSRRNIVTRGVELMWLIGREFRVGEALLRGVKYCDPCKLPSKLAGTDTAFDEAFHDRGGLVAEVIKGGMIRENDVVVPPPKGY